MCSYSRQFQTRLLLLSSSDEKSFAVAFHRPTASILALFLIKQISSSIKVLHLAALSHCGCKALHFPTCGRRLFRTQIFVYRRITVVFSNLEYSLPRWSWLCSSVYRCFKFFIADSFLQSMAIRIVHCRLRLTTSTAFDDTAHDYDDDDGDD
jgi:hypothetical protein